MWRVCGGGVVGNLLVFSMNLLNLIYILCTVDVYGIG
jgi:hypothetical protein